MESLGDEAFYGDWRIAEVDIPSTVTNIGVNAFGGDSPIIRIGLRGDSRMVSAEIQAVLKGRRGWMASGRLLKGRRRQRRRRCGGGGAVAVTRDA